jgi:hypothetical protein
MDFKDFKKVGVTKSHTIFEHPAGHVIHVAHESMPQKLKNEMRQIPVSKMAEGGDVEEPAISEDIMGRLEALKGQPPQEPTPVPVAELSTAQEPENKNFIPAMKAEVSKEEPAMQIAPSAGPQTAVMGGAQQIQAEQGLGQAEAARAAAEQRQIQQNIIDLQNFEKARQQRHNENRQHVQDSIKAFADHPEIDPNRYLGNMDTGQRIMTAIGLLLGGIGAGAAGTENMALKYMMGAIDKDIDAQKQSLDKKNTIYKANLQMLKDEDQAEDMTRAQMIELAKLKMGQAALTQGSQIAKLNHDKIIGQLMAAQEGPLGRLSQVQTMAQYAGKETSDPAVVNMMINALPPAEQKDARKVYETYTNAGQALNTVIPKMRRIADLGMSGKIFSLQERQNIKQLNQELIKVSAQLVASPELRARMSKDAVNTLINPYKIDVASFGASDLQKVQNLEKALMEAQSNAADALGGHRIKLAKPIPQTRLQTRK